MAKMFQGKDTKAEEMAEAKALRSGKISKADYVAGEKKEGHGKGAAKVGAAIKSGKMTAGEYAAAHKDKKMADGGYAKMMADGGYVCGHRSKQDYGKK